LVSHFIIEKRTGPADWAALITMPADNSKEIYSTTDAGIFPGDNFYRLRVTERSGVVYYSAVRRVFYDEGRSGFSFYPNPAVHSITIYRKELGAATVALTDISGKLLLQKNIVNMREEMTLPVLAPGVYFIQINDMVKKLVVR